MTEPVIEGGNVGPDFGIRLRFRASKGFNTAESTIAFETGGHKVVLASPVNKPLRQGGWYSLKAVGFDDLGEAEEFGSRLCVALQIASIRRMLGVDVGRNEATSSLSKFMYDEFAAQGAFVRPNVHGLDVFENRPGTKWLDAAGEGSVSTDPTAILEDIAQLVGKVDKQPPSKFDAVRLLNEALVSVEAAARLTLAIAAVEMLAQGEKWSASQIKAIEGLVASLEGDATLSDRERQEVVEAVGRIYRIGVLEGFRRLLERLGLSDLWLRWRDLYQDRSKILHGLTYATPRQRLGMVAPAILFSARIVLTALDADIPGAATGLNSFLHLPPVYKKFGSKPASSSREEIPLG